MMPALVVSLMRRRSSQSVSLPCFQSSRGYSWGPDIIVRAESVGGLGEHTSGNILVPEKKVLVPGGAYAVDQKVLVPGGACAVDQEVLVPGGSCAVGQEVLLPGSSYAPGQEVLHPNKPFRYDCRGFKKHIDWRSFYPKSKIPKISDQYGSTCWAHAAACAIEWMHLVRTGERKEVSVQQLIDYDIDNSSDAYVALQRLRKTGIASVDTYPYVDGRRHKMKNIDPIIRVKRTAGWNQIHKYNYLRLMEMLQDGPAIVWVRIEEDTMFGIDEYCIDSPGIFRYPVYGVPNHTMVCVGYDFRVEPLWFFQNSWSKDHANDGYLYYGQREYPKPDDQFCCFPFICHRPILG